MIQQYSADWVRHSNHSRLSRGVCLSRRCPRTHSPQDDDQEWFESCVNSSIMAEYKMSARLTQLEYCTREPQGGRLTAAGAAFLVLLAVLVVVAAVSTVMDLRLSSDRKKGYGYLLSWSLLRSWQMLTEPVQTADTDLRFLDGLRAISMTFIILLHTAAFLVVFNVADTRLYEQNTFLLVNGHLTLLVQVFFIVSSFLMARKVLQQENGSARRNFLETMQNRIVRILPSYIVVILYMVSVHEYLGSGPTWHRIVKDEVDTCQEIWWMNILFLNNFNTGLKCLFQTWYLAADMQLYAAGLLLTLLLRGRRAVPVLAVLLATTAVFYVCVAYAWHLIPVYALHVPDNLYREYSGVTTFDVLYQSPWGNTFAALTGLLLAHAHLTLKTSKYDFRSSQVFRWVAMLAAPSIVLWILVWPCIHPLGPPTRLRSALLAGLVGPVMCLLTAILIIDQLQESDSLFRRFLSSRVFSVLARLSLPVLLVHFPIARVQLAAKDWPEHLNLFKLTFNAFGVWAMSYTAAAVLALLVELPTQRLYRELRGASRSRDKRND
ncbi:O-acyltransferase like protein-like [Aricia agestis]|uniref:O-acyltransferase like protein-like n=1 Tax=Aricia agestis TaxID=91739 RepID=UPI001C20B9CB|nr:O-acyltransferase like protein-like [Aricia agestis]